MSQRDRDDDGGSDNVLTWIADVPLLTNPVIVRATFLLLVLSYLSIAVIAVIIAATDGHLEHLPDFLAALLIGVGVVAALLFFVMLLFGNRMRCRFFIDDEGLSSIVVDRRAEIASSLAFMAGSASGDTKLVGAGLAATAARREFTKWSRVAGARFVPRRHFIGLTAAGWWPVGSIYCSAESYPAVAARVRAILDARTLPSAG